MAKRKSPTRLQKVASYLAQLAGGGGLFFPALLRGPHSDHLTEKISRHQLIYSILGLVLGLVCVIGGIILFLLGVTGAMSWTAKFLGASSEILDAAPGAVLFIVGLFIVFLTRYSFRSTRNR